MKVEKFDGAQRRRLLAHLIYSDLLVARMAHLRETRTNMLRTPVENMLLDWCVNYYRSHGTAPGDNIQWILSDYADSPMYDELGALVEAIPRIDPPSSLSMILGDVCEYLDKVALEKLANTVLSRVSQDDVDGCVDALGKFTRVSLGVSTSINPFTDKTALIETFSDDSCKSLLSFDTWGQDARDFFGDTFSRSSFVVFNAPEKGCKSATLLELAVQALKEGKKVAYFEAGDMSRPQVFRRLYQRISEHPRRKGTIKFPKADEKAFWVDKRSEDGPVIHVEFEELPFNEDLTLEIAEEAVVKWSEENGDMKRMFRFSDHPQDLTAPRISSQLEEWERQDGFVPDFVIVDYADLLQPVIKNEFRHQINDTFARLRAISLDKKCCLITATQAKAGSYNADTQSRTLISEDKRKAAYPTAMIGIASTQEEREQQVYHMNYILRRDDACIESVKLYFAQCLPICNPMVRCYLPESHRGENHGVFADDEDQMKRQRKLAEGAAGALSGLGSPEFGSEDNPFAEDEDEKALPAPKLDVWDMSGDSGADEQRRPCTIHVPEEYGRHGKSGQPRAAPSEGNGTPPPTEKWDFLGGK